MESCELGETFQAGCCCRRRREEKKSNFESDVCILSFVYYNKLSV
jgi:hypothetical protein